MPGICGFITSHDATHSAETLLTSMQESLVYRSRHVSSPLFHEGNTAATDVHFTFLPKQTCWQDDSCAVWIDGEFFVHSDSPHTEVLARTYQKGTLLQFLKNVDGIFSAIIYDRRKKILHLVTDRFGLKHLYLVHDANGFAWSSELKALRVLPWFSPQVSAAAFTEFSTLGHFTGARTWFDKVTLMNPGTILSLSADTLKPTTTIYHDILADEPTALTTDDNEILQKLGNAFRTAVEKRCGRGERTGVGLSGGLDSRAIFAAMPTHCEPVQALTFGRNGCKDSTLAQKVSALRPSQHTIQTIDEHNWFNNRPEGIWITDGQVNLLHMHGIEQIDSIPEQYDIELNGFLGDALLGGSYAGAPGGEMRHYLDRGRRMIATALAIGNITYHTRLPFFDRELFTLIRAIPVALRKNSAIYNKMLLTHFPEYFTTIPWQKTGMPITKSGPFWHMVHLMKKGVTKLSSRLLPGDSSQYFDYAAWVKSATTWKLFTDILSDDQAEIRAFVATRTTDALLERHVRGHDCSDLICRFATAELWMRQYFRNEWPHG